MERITISSGWLKAGAVAILTLAMPMSSQSAITLLDTIGDGSKYQLGRDITRSVQLGYDNYPLSGDFTGARPESAVGGVNLLGTSGVPAARLFVAGAPGSLTQLDGSYASWVVQPFTLPSDGFINKVEFVTQFRNSAVYTQGAGRTAYIGIIEAPVNNQLTMLPAMTSVNVGSATLGSIVTAIGLNKAVTAGQPYWLVFAPVNSLGSWNSGGLDYANLNWYWEEVIPDTSKVSAALLNNNNGNGTFLTMQSRALGVRLSGFSVTPADKKAGEAKNTSDGTVVSLTGAVVTAKTGAVGPGFFYVEQPDRSAGIRIIGTTTANVGDTVNIVGTMTTVGVERAITADTVSPSGAPVVIGPLGIQNQKVAGETNGLALGATDAIGLNNVGMLVRVFGAASGAAGNDFVVSDGGKDIKCRAAAGITKPTSGQVVVTGIVSLELDGSDRVPVILVRSQSDITVP